MPSVPNPAGPTPIPLARLRAPATTLIVLGTVNGVIGLLGCCSRIGQAGSDPIQGDADTAQLVTYTALSVLSLLSVLLAPLIIVGAVRMRQGRNYGLAMTTAILAISPVTCLFLIGIPVGIWAVLTLRRPDVRQLFATRGVPSPAPYGPQSYGPHL